MFLLDILVLLSIVCIVTAIAVFLVSNFMALCGETFFYRQYKNVKKEYGIILNPFKLAFLVHEEAFRSNYMEKRFKNFFVCGFPYYLSQFFIKIINEKKKEKYEHQYRKKLEKYKKE